MYIVPRIHYPSRMRFLLQTILFPKHTGAVAPSSRKLADVMAANARLEDAKVVVELGPGTGTFTGRIMERLAPRATFFCIEINPSFAAATRKRFPTVPVYEDSAANLATLLKRHGHETCDRVISGLPWTAFPAKEQDALLSAIYDAMSPGALFLTFAYVPFNALPLGRRFKETLRKRFRTVRTTKVVANMPPAFFYVCEK
ncbi:MAG: hypothetical protein RLZZ324_374 [Candidatus Parcubacteria bacterium]